MRVQVKENSKEGEARVNMTGISGVSEMFMFTLRNLQQEIVAR